MHPAHQESHQTMYRDNHRHLLLQHQHAHQTQINEPNHISVSSSILHRPLHPPPPPPRSQHQIQQQQQQQQQQATSRCATTTAITTLPVENLDSINNLDYYLEEVIQAILAAKEALEKPIEERDDRDILLIDNPCSLVHGFDAFPRSVRRALAAQAVLIVIDEKGKELIVHNEELDSFCVLIFGECEQLNVAKTTPIRYYTVGDAFGVCEPTTDTIRFVGHMVTRCENCAFLCVKRDDFYTILTDPANYPNKETVRYRDRDGNIICVSQFVSARKSSEPPWSNQTQSNPFKIRLPDGHIIVKATESYLLMALVDGYDRKDPEYIDDFLLLFRVFMTYDQKDREKQLPPGMIKLCLTLTQWLDHVEYRDKVVKIVLTWLSSYYHDFELNPEFSFLFFKVLESRLLNLSMNNQLHLLHVTLSTKSKTRHVTIARSSRELQLPFSIAGGYEKNCGIFVTQVNGANFDDRPFENFERYLNNSLNLSDRSRYHNPTKHRPPLNHQDLSSGQEETVSRLSSQLRPGDQILEVNGTNFAAISLIEAQKRLGMFTHLSLTVKFNPSAFHEMRALPEGRRKSSMSSLSSVSPYPMGGQKFTFNLHDPISHHPSIQQVQKNGNDSHPPISPLFSANADFGFRSFVTKSAARNDRSRLSNLISSSKQFVKQIRDSTALNGNIVETSSKISDNVSDDQGNGVEGGKSKSNSDLANLKGKDKQIESGLSTVVRLDELDPTAIAENQAGSMISNQALVNVLKVFNAANNDFRYLLVHEETTAREVVMVAVKEFNLSVNLTGQLTPGEKTISSLNWHLYEVSVVPESKTIKQKCLSEQTTRLAERASLSSRFYIKNNTQSSAIPSHLDMGDDALVNEILKESPPNVTLTSLNATLLAVELTLTNFNKFRSIEPQQYVYDTFFNCSEKSVQKQENSSSRFNPSGSISSQDTASLKSSSSDSQSVEPVNVLHSLNKTRSVPKDWMDEYRQFADISNREMFWVICEILNEKNIDRRVKIVKQFVRVADVCSQLRNYNSMFAIISGLGHSCVSRLRRTFDKLKPKYKNQLEKMRDLFDPWKNMSKYRKCLKDTPPPAIPLFPQIKKDLTFTKEGRSVFVRESNDLSGDDDDDDDGGGGHQDNNPCGGFSQDTIKRVGGTNGKLRGCASVGGGDLISVKSAIINPYHSGTTIQHHNNQLALKQTRSISYTSFNNHHHHHTSQQNLTSILVDFVEIRQFTEIVRDVIYYSSIPYSSDLLTNTKDNQRTQAQIKRMHEEWQMRKRIRHYLTQTLNGAILDLSTTQQQSSSLAPATTTTAAAATSSSSSSSLSLSSTSQLATTATIGSASGSVKGIDQPDGSLSSTSGGAGGSAPVSGKPAARVCLQSNGKINITYDERTLYERSLEIEPELNHHHHHHHQPSHRSQAASEPPRQLAQHSRPSNNNNNNTTNHHQLPQVPPAAVLMNMQPPPTLKPLLGQPPIPSMANNNNNNNNHQHHHHHSSSHSPTLSKSSSLSSCSSFSHHNYHLPANYHHHAHVARASGCGGGGGGGTVAGVGVANLSSQMGKFGTESNENLRKLRLLSENHAPENLCRSSYTSNSSSGASTGNSRDDALNKLSTATTTTTTSTATTSSGDSGRAGGLSAKNLITSRIFPHRASGASGSGGGGGGGNGALGR